MNADVEAGRQRRALPPEEFAALIAAARQGLSVRRLSGEDRAMLYLVAAYTGLRESELFSLTPQSFDLDADPPMVTVEAGSSKRRRRDTLPVRPDLADLIREWLADKPAEGKLWPGGWWRHGAKMVRVDLAAAGIPFEDGTGRVFDFHALRHQFISNLAAAGVHPKIAQLLARHSTITLTLDRYTHVGLMDQTAALDQLPQLPTDGGGEEAGRLSATGTEGGFSCTSSCTKVVRTVGSSCAQLRAIEDGSPQSDARPSATQTLKLQAVEGHCGQLRVVDTEEAPPGFEPGLADLQSTALPLG